jgi:hypothetical protein
MAVAGMYSGRIWSVAIFTATATATFFCYLKNFHKDCNLVKKQVVIAYKYTNQGGLKRKN